MRWLVLLLATGAVLIIASAAGGYAVGTSVTVKPGARADFISAGWFCRNLGRSVDCQSGDAYPWAKLTGTARGGVTVHVHTLNGGGVRVRTIHHRARAGNGPNAWDEIVYTLSAF